MSILKNPYPHKMTKLYTGIFGTLFNDIKIERDDGKIISVPLVLSSKRGYIVRNDQNPDPLELRYSKQLPIIGMTFTGWEKDNERMTSRYNKITHATKDRITNTLIETQYNKVPYTFMYELYIKTKTFDDMFQITEAIMALFNPNVEVVVKDNPLLDTETGISIKLVSTSLEDDYAGSFEEGQSIEVTMQFELEGYILQPTYDTSIIHQVNVNYKDLEYLTDIDSQVIT